MIFDLEDITPNQSAFLLAVTNTKMKVYILVLLIAAVFIDIGLSKPTHSRKKRQLAGTGVAFGQ